MSDSNRGAELLIAWREAKGLTQTAASPLVSLDLATYNAFEHGRKKPGYQRALKIEQGTGGAVPMLAWSQPPRKAKRDTGTKRRVA